MANSKKSIVTTDNPEQVAQEVVKKKRSRPDISERQSIHTNPGDNTKYINHSLRLAEFPRACMQNPKEVEERVIDYFRVCAEDDMKPSVAGLALAMGIDKTYLWELRVGRKGESEEVANSLKKAMQILDAQMNGYMQNGAINPVTGIFLMKNNFGYADKQEVVVTPNTDMLANKSSAELAERYLEDIPIVDE